MTPQERYRALLAAERDRRDPRRGEDARQRLLDELERMAQRLAATAHLYPLHVDDMSPAEKLACHLLPESLRPAGLMSEDEIWSEFRERKKRAGSGVALP